MSHILEYGDSPDTIAFNALNPVAPAAISHPVPRHTERCYDCGRNWATNRDHGRALCTRCMRAVEHDSEAHRRRMERRSKATAPTTYHYYLPSFVGTGAGA